MKKIVGIHLGVEEICASVYDKGSCRTLFKIPAYVSIAPTGEILTGARAVRYKKCHEKEALYSVAALLKDSSALQASYKGTNLDDVFLCLTREIRRKLDETPWKDQKTCIISISACPFHIKEKLRKYMNQAGFEVLRMINTVVACSYCTLYGAAEESHHIGFAVEGDNLEIALIENDEMIFEVVALASFTTGANKSIRTSFLMDLLKQKCPEEEKEYVDNAPWLWYGDQKMITNNSDKLIWDVSVSAAAGAAVYGAQLLGEISDKLALLAVPNAYGMEIVASEGKNTQQFLEFQWMFQEQTVIPARSKAVVCERKAGMKWEETLNVYEKVSAYEDTLLQKNNLIATGKLRNIFADFSKTPDKVSISLVFDSSGKLSMEVKDLESGEIINVPFSLKYSVQSSNKRAANFIQKQILASVWNEMKQISQSVEQLTPQQKAEPVGAGLLKIEKQCKQFMEKRGMSFQIPPNNGEIYSIMEETEIALAEDLLQIADSMEYGVKLITSKSLDHLERTLVQHYWSFLKCLENSMNIRPVPAEGEYFNTEYHYAVMHETDANKEDNLVAEELQRGYYLRDTVLRPSKVKVLN